MAIDFAFLDSGTGGIPYMLLLKEKSPQSRCVYLGDTIHFPYGEKSVEEVTECAAAAIKNIVQKWSPRVVVVACNTISVTALQNLRALFPNLPIVGTVPAIKLAANVTQNKKIGLLATNASVNHPYCQKLIDDFARDCQVFKRGDPELISFVEHKLFTATPQEKLDAVAPAVDFFAKSGCDTIILGCTHFTHLSREIEDAFSKKSWKKVFVVDSREGVSNRALKVVNDKSPDAVNEAKEDSALGAQNAQGGVSENTSPIPPDESFFVTELKGEDDKMEYETLCKNFNIPFGGVI